MPAKMGTAETKEIYKVRKQTVVPVFGDIKAIRECQNYSLEE